MASSPTHKNLSALKEAEDSGTLRIDNGKITRTRIYHATKAVCDANVVYFGTAGTGAETGFQVLSCVSEAIGAEQGRLTIVWEAAGPGSGATLPPDEVSVTGSNQSPRIERHPRWIPLPAAAMQLVRDYIQGSTPEKRADGWIALQDLGNPDAIALAELMDRGNESFYLASLQYGWATHSWTRPTMYRGGWIETPGGPLAGYFSGDIDWLRQADDLQYNNGIWRLTYSWIGGMSGQWNTGLYPV